jgi:hypothetical protein
MSAALSQLENERLRLDGGVRHIWREVVAGRMDEAERDGRLADIEAQRHALRGKTRGDLAVAVPVPHQRTGARAVDRSRQRRLAAAGPMPPRLAARFTTGQLACLNIVANEVAAKGSCSLTNSEVARRAGACRRTAVGAVREAELLCMIRVKRRRLSATMNLPNIVTVIDKEWWGWLQRRGAWSPAPRRAAANRCAKNYAQAGTIHKKEDFRDAERPQEVSRGSKSARWRPPTPDRGGEDG